MFHLIGEYIEVREAYMALLSCPIHLSLLYSEMVVSWTDFSCCTVLGEGVGQCSDVRRTILCM